MVLAGGDRRPRHRLGRGSGSTTTRGPEWTTWFTGDGLDRQELHPRWAGATREGSGRSSPVRTVAARAHSQSSRGTSRGSRRASAQGRARRPRGDLPADVPRGGDRLARLRTSARCRCRSSRASPRRGGAAAPRLGAEGRDHRRLFAAAGRPARMRRTVDEAVRESTVRRARRHVGARLGLGRDRGREPRRAAPARGPERAPVPARTRPARPAGRGSPPRAGRLPRLDHARGRLPGGRHPDDVLHFSTDMGWIMGPWAVVGGGALGCTLVFAEGAPDRPPDRSGSSSRTSASRYSASRRPSSAPSSRTGSPRPTSPPSGRRHDRRAVEPGPVPLALRAGRRRAAPDHQLLRGTEVAACFLSPTPAIPIKECSLGGPRSGWRWTSSTPTAPRWSGRAR